MSQGINFQLGLEEAVAAVKQAGHLINALSCERAYEARRKFATELVTTADLRADQMIREHLAAKFPDHAFFTEETATEEMPDFSGPVWIIDPIDGTANYVHGHPYVSISAALVLDGDPCLGVVHAPFLDETYTAIRGAGAFCNGCAIHVSDVAELRQALIGTGFPHDRSSLDLPMARVRRLLSECQDIRRAGSPALDICWVAAGRLDGHCESLAAWDIAAAGLIATEAGASRGNLAPADSSLPAALRGEEFIVATPAIFDRLCEMLTTT